MSKTHTPYPNPPGPAPCLTIYHAIADPTTPPFADAYHVIALWDAPAWNPLHLLVRLAYMPDDTFSWGDIDARQLAAASYLINYPDLISHACPVCNDGRGHPWHIRWAQSPGEHHHYGFPACGYDGVTWTPVWAPSTWPPAYLI